MKSNIVTPEDVNTVKGNANFGDRDPYQMVRTGLLQIASGFSCGHTLTCIMNDLGLITKRRSLTKKGKENLWEWYHNNPPLTGEKEE